MMVGGIISVASISRNTGSRPANLYFDRAKAAMEFSSRVRTVATVVMNTLFHR